jgi:hypothetical protein
MLNGCDDGNLSAVHQELHLCDALAAMLITSTCLGVFSDYCKEYIPDLYDKLENLGIAACITLSWFLTLFIA